MPNPMVYFDIVVGEGTKGLVVIELFVDTNPRMVENFRLLCTGEVDKALHYKGCRLDFDAHTDSWFAQVPMRTMHQLDLRAENVIKMHNGYGPGTVWMMADKLNFNIVGLKTQALKAQTGGMVVGQVVKGLDFLKRVEGFFHAISDCGQLPEPKVLSKRPQRELVGMMSNSNKQLLDTAKQIKNVTEQLIREVDATEVSKEHLAGLEKMANHIRNNLAVLTDLEANVTCLKEHHGKLLDEMDTIILNLKAGKVISERIPSLPDEILDDIERTIKKVKSSRCK